MNTIKDKLKNYNLILGSASPRRQQMFTDMGFVFTVQTSDANEDAPQNLDGFETAVFVAKQKAAAIIPKLTDLDILITADTEVWQGRKRFGKPANLNEARTMLQTLAGTSHLVISGVCFTHKDLQHSFTVKTEVHMRALADEEIDYYITHGNPLDKAGAYGIQEWIGLVAIARIDGSYTNVVGMPMAEVYCELEKFLNQLP
jgi:septum formation protein